MTKVLGVGGLFFKSHDPQSLYQWYSQWLGLSIELESGVTFVALQPGSMPTSSYTVWSAFAAETTYFAPSDKPFMFNLVVDDLEEALGQVRAGGAQVVGDIEKGEYGHFGWFLDSDGNKVELWQPRDSAV